MNKENKDKASAEVFAANPEVELMFQTKDGQCFTDEHMAGVHAASIGDKVSDYDKVSRPSKPEVKTSKEPEVKVSKEPEVKTSKESEVK